MRNRRRVGRTTHTLDNTHAYIDAQATDVTLPTDTNGADAGATQQSDPTTTVDTTQQSDPTTTVDTTQQPDTSTTTTVDDTQQNTDNSVEGLDDTAWLEALTPIEQTAPDVGSSEGDAVVPTTTANPPTTATNPPAETAHQEVNIYDGLEYIEQELAEEVQEKLITPQIASLQAEVSQVRQYQEQQAQARQNTILQKTNERLWEKYPNVQNILNSTEFRDYVNSNGNKYATETGYELLGRAYRQGDADFVLETIDGFAASRSKPKPSVGVEPQQGSGGNRGVERTPEKRTPMSLEEYSRRRDAIRRAPRGSVSPTALRDLYNEYQQSNQG